LFALIVGCVALIVSARVTGAVVMGLVVLGSGQRHGHAGSGDGDRRAIRRRLVRHDRRRRGLHDHRCARLAPVAAALYAGLLGYSGLLWTLAALATTAAVLAWRAERLAVTTATAPT
jgi:hypothetical protein